jgi:hypothetical protein
MITTPAVSGEPGQAPTFLVAWCGLVWSELLIGVLWDSVVLVVCILSCDVGEQ